jgi:hypothetical protein
MVALGNNVHIFARPHRRQELTWLFETVLSAPVATIGLPAASVAQINFRAQPTPPR